MNKQFVTLGVTGGIAAYKAADLCSKMVQCGYEVQIIMTESATKLVGERTFLTLSHRPVITSLWDVPEWRPEHVALAEHADLLVVAPCTANFIGKYTHGIADDALSTCALAHRGTVLLAPAMNPNMWHHPAVQNNIKLLAARNVEFIGPEIGHVACGDDGTGRMAEPADILTKIKTLLNCP